MVQNILTFSTDEKISFLDSFDYIISDIEGVAWNVRCIWEDLETAVKNVHTLEKYGKKVYFVSNNLMAEQFADPLIDSGMHCETAYIMHPAESVIEYLDTIEFHGIIYLIGSEVFKTFLNEAGYDIVHGPHNPYTETIQEIEKAVFDNLDVRAVVIDFDVNINYAKLCRANNYLKHPDCILVIGTTWQQYEIKENTYILGLKPFTQILSDLHKEKTKVLGKSGKELAEIIITKYNIEDPRRVLVIGDRLDEDIGFGKELGFKSMLVLKGKTTVGQMLASTDNLPDYYVSSMDEFLKMFSDVEHKQIHC